MRTNLAGLIPDIYAAVDIVSREATGFINASTLYAGADSAALGQAIKVPLAPPSVAVDNTPGLVSPNDGAQTIDNEPLTIQFSKNVPFVWEGEEQLAAQTGIGAESLRVNQIAQAIRALTNEVEASIAQKISRASRAYGTPGTTPFATTLADPAQVLKILIDNGAPQTDLQLVIDTSAGANLRTMAQLTKANEAGTTSVREMGTLLDIHRFKVRESAGVQQTSSGTASGYVLNGAHAKGATTIAVSTGTGTIPAGSVVTIGAQKYVVKTAISGGAFAINMPGLTSALPSGTAVTILAAATANFAFSRSSLLLATRAPAMPDGGDGADFVEAVTDPVSGITYTFVSYGQYQQRRYEVKLAWGSAVIKPAHTALLLG